MTVGRPGCPPPDLLLSTMERTLSPPELAARVSAHIAQCALCAEVAAAMIDAAGSPTGEEAARIAAGVSRGTQVHRRTWRSAYAVAATLVSVAAGAYLVQFTERTAAPAVQAPARSPEERPAPPMALPLAAPRIELPPESLTLRGATPDPYADRLERALEPFVRGRFDLASAGLERVALAYPRSVHAALYLGVSRLMDGHSSEAIPALERARELAPAGTSLYGEATWYVAVALERSGKAESAVGPLLELCGSSGARDAQACDGLGRLLLNR